MQKSKDSATKMTNGDADNMCFNESGVSHFAGRVSLLGNSVLRIEVQWFKSRLLKAQNRYRQL